MKVMLFSAVLGIGLVGTALPEPVEAQVIRAEIILGQPRYHDRVVHVYRPARRVVTHRYAPRYAPRVIVVERYHRGRGHGKHGRDFRRIRAWYDRDRALYYDGYRPGLREVAVYYAGGQYYDDWDDRDRERYRDRDRWDD